MPWVQRWCGLGVSQLQNRIRPQCLHVAWVAFDAFAVVRGVSNQRRGECRWRLQQCCWSGVGRSK